MLWDSSKNAGSDSVGLAQGLSCSVSTKLPGDAAAAGPWTTLRVARAEGWPTAQPVQVRFSPVAHHVLVFQMSCQLKEVTEDSQQKEDQKKKKKKAKKFTALH